jgi:hypothetical protein
MAREVARAAGRGECQGMTVLLVGYDEMASAAVKRAVEGA